MAGEALSRALKRHPELLAAEERRMKASAAVLQQLLAEETFSRTMRECPEALLAEAADLLELGRVFADYEVSLDKVVQRSPRLLLCKAQQVRNILGFLQDEPSGPGMSREQVGEVAERFPMLLLGCRNVEQQLAPLVSFLRSLGVDPKCAACRGFYAWPEAHKVLEPTARYLLDECGYGPKELAENVDVLGYSLEARIYPRGRFLQHLKTRLPLRVHAAADDFQFCQLLGVRREQFLEFALDLRREMRLYSRAVPVAVKSSSFALSFGLPLRMYSPHRKGCVAASCALEKKTVYMRSIRDESIKSKEFCAKDVWVIEPANHEFLKDTGIEYSVTLSCRA
ncbi:unnamed protein product [Effrenium voratum]|uniref:Uncharacterized protein n=1 Tax=Effrenium voratum TaxID=2562239 RepID=A0AA36ITU4_9DINO|nr:unnamed protein product [Effrenium voratum]